MNYVLFDGQTHARLLPITYTRPVGELRIGILTIKEKWERLLNATISYLTQDYLSDKYICRKTDDMLLINGAILPDADLVNTLGNLEPLHKLVNAHGDVLAVRCREQDLTDSFFEKYEKVVYPQDYDCVSSLASIFLLNDKQIRADYELITKNGKSQPLSSTNRLVNPENIFVEDGVKAEFAIIDASDGPVYLGKNSTVMAGAIIQGPFAMCENATVKMGSRIYDATTVGPYCKVGGEVENTVFIGYANKAHEGFVGNSVIGHWCNLGADTNTSNLKNTYENVKLWSIENGKFEDTGTMFCGTIMGDHSKCGINTMFNTGTVVGVCCNVFGGGFPRTYIPSFAWGGSSGFTTYHFDKAMQVAKVVEKRRNVNLTEQDIAILRHIFDCDRQN